ncbi:hypothetical protein [Spiroplasma endosymbiont of Polydrusus pterygomalis]|uniref:hypothetical protein n=1 Tax=Spiroplasma endosymbiont of Polydrusus pterygomalis TaxID=3139327 RepID=UPI003CCAAFE1
MIPQIIELIYYMLASNDIRILIFDLLKDYFKNKDFQETLKNENVSKEELDQPYSIFNPNILKKLLNIITPDEIKYLRSIINKLSKFSEKGVTKENKEKLNKAELNKDSQDWVILSSSWFKKGTFYKSNIQLKSGLLTGLFQSDTSKNKRWYGPYTYPSFPEEIWVLMTQQRGKNGSGAGSIFWKYWLRSWLPSQLRAYVKKNLKDTLGITKGRKSYYVLQAKNINILKTSAFINRLERGFFRLKTYKTLSSSEIGSKAYRDVRRTIFTTNKNSTFKNIGYSIYKNKNTYKKYSINGKSKGK